MITSSALLLPILFTGFAPFNDPEVVVTVYFDLGVGGDKAAPVAGKIIKYFMENVER